MNKITNESDRIGEIGGEVVCRIKVVEKDVGKVESKCANVSESMRVVVHLSAAACESKVKGANERASVSRIERFSKFVDLGKDFGKGISIYLSYANLCSGNTIKVKVQRAVVQPRGVLLLLVAELALVQRLLSPNDRVDNIFLSLAAHPENTDIQHK